MVFQLPDVIVAAPVLPAVEPKIASALVTLPPLTRKAPLPADVPTVRSAAPWLIAPPLVTSSVPPPMLVPPLKVFAPESVSVPAPSFSSVLPTPARAVANVTAWPPVSTRIARPSAELIREE